MTNILATIIDSKKKEIQKLKAMYSIEALQRKDFFSRPTYSLKEFLLDTTKTGIIAEFKRKSPSKGIINDTATVEDVTQAYTKYGASGLSVLTDLDFFGGAENDLRIARANRVPILRKDFIIDEYQLIESKAMGADVILLIAACLTPLQVRELANFAHQLDLEVLLEIHDELELHHICDEIDLVGVNSRNLKTFEVDITTLLSVGEKIPSDKIKIAESGITDVETINQLKQQGFKGFLMGERFMKEIDPGEAFRLFVDKLKKNFTGL